MEQIDLAKLLRNKAIEYCVKYLGYNSTDAELIVSIARGEIDGDVIDISKESVKIDSLIIDDEE